MADEFNLSTRAGYFYAIASRALEVGHQLDEGRLFGWRDAHLQGRIFTDPASAWTNNLGLDALEAWSRPAHPAWASPPTYASARKVFAHQSDVLLAWRAVLTGAPVPRGRLLACFGRLNVFAGLNMFATARGITV